MFSRLCIVLFVTGLFVTGANAQEDKGVQPPTVISAPKPVYPKEAKDAGIGCRITVRVVVSESGEVLSVDEPNGPTQLCNGETTTGVLSRCEIR